MKQLGEILLEEGLVDEAQLMHALDVQIERGSSLGRVLVELGMGGGEASVRTTDLSHAYVEENSAYSS